MIDIKPCPWCLQKKDWHVSLDFETWTCICERTVYHNMFELIEDIDKADLPIISPRLEKLNS